MKKYYSHLDQFLKPTTYRFDLYKLGLNFKSHSHERINYRSKTSQLLVGYVHRIHKHMPCAVPRIDAQHHANDTVVANIQSCLCSQFVSRPKLTDIYFIAVRAKQKKIHLTSTHTKTRAVSKHCLSLQDLFLRDQCHHHH